MNKLLVVYNTCGLKKDNTLYYLKALQSILDQDFDGFHVVVSSCMNTNEQIKALQDTFKNRISYNVIREIRTVNTTFNHTVQQCVKEFGEFEGYLFMDSGCSFKDNVNILKKMYNTFKSGPYSMVSGPTHTDSLFLHQFGWEYPPQDFVINEVGKAVNCHTQIFSNDIYLAFEKKIICDIFASFCTESTFPFLNAVVGKKWAISSGFVIHHEHSMDGASAGFGHGNWRHLLPGARSIDEIINDPEGTACGFGYEELNRIKLHNPTAYNSDGSAKYPERLRQFLLKNVFLPQSVLNYDNIKHIFIPGVNQCN